MNAASAYLNAAQTILDRIIATQMDNIQRGGRHLYRLHRG